MQSTTNSGTPAGLARRGSSWNTTLTTVVRSVERGGLSWLRLAPCARCSGRHRLLAESDGVLLGHCLGCGASLDTPLATERIAPPAPDSTGMARLPLRAREGRAQPRVPPATPVVPQPAGSGRSAGRW